MTEDSNKEAQEYVKSIKIISRQIIQKENYLHYKYTLHEIVNIK